MADQHYEVDETLKPARDLMDALRALASAWDRVVRVRGTMIQSKDTPAVGIEQFATIATRYGYVGADTTAKKTEASLSFAEIDAAFGAGDAAIQQLLNRHL
jgi:hypothetical protein